MEPQETKRKLTTIFSTDVKGYSRLMSEDEAATVRTLKAYREVISSHIEKHGGRVIDSPGDNLLAEFGSVVHAVESAVEIQQALKERNEELPEYRKMEFRIGINLGDVIADGERLYGEGVNIAARLESLAEGGGICISGDAYRQVRDRLPFGFEDLGEHSVKNLPRPVHAYRVLMEPEAAGTLSAAKRMGQKPRQWAVVAAVAVFVLGGAALWNFYPRPPRIEPASVKRMAFPLPEKPSIAVLPFLNMSGDPKQEYFADGITEDLITDLSKISGLFVIARNSVFTYKGKSVKIRQVAEEMGVRYVLEGSVRRVGDQVRINAQLIDSTTGGHLWAERYDGSLADVFALQDRVTQKIVAALAVNLTPGEKALQTRPETGNPEAYDAFLRGWLHYRRNSPDDFAKAVPYFEKAIELDPNYSRAYAALAAVYWAVVDKNWSTGTSIWARRLGITSDEGIHREKQNLQEAMKNPVPLAHQVASGRLSRQGQHEAAIAEARRAISMDTNDPVAHEAMATALIYAGRPAEAPPHIKQAMRLDPRFPHEYLYWLGLAQFGMERYEDAVGALAKAAQSNPDDDRSLIILAAAYGHLKREREAKSAIGKANRLRGERQRRLTGTGMKAGIDVLLLGPYTQNDVALWPFKIREDRERLREGLRLAGVPKVGTGKKVSLIEIAGATTVDAAAAKVLLDRGVPFIDVRGTNSYNNGHIPGAVNLWFKKGFSESALSAVVAKGQEVVIYCMGER